MICPRSPEEGQVRQSMLSILSVHRLQDKQTGNSCQFLDICLWTHQLFIFILLLNSHGNFSQNEVLCYDSSFIGEGMGLRDVR